jgi:RNase P subunit RPR2
MGKWMDKLIKKHTCKFCDKKLNSKEIYRVNMDTLEGPHTMTLCEPCAMDLDSFLKEVEEARNDLTS